LETGQGNFGRLPSVDKSFSKVARRCEACLCTCGAIMSMRQQVETVPGPKMRSISVRPFSQCGHTSGLPADVPTDFRWQHVTYSVGVDCSPWCIVGALAASHSQARGGAMQMSILRTALRDWLGVGTYLQSCSYALQEQCTSRCLHVMLSRNCKTWKGSYILASHRTYQIRPRLGRIYPQRAEK
jgi:hypothetical protein